jgi:hypothetical protein
MACPIAESLVGLGAIELLVQMIREYHVDSPLVLVAALLTIASLTFGCPASKSALVDAGGAHAVTCAAKRHPGCLALQRAAMLTLNNISSCSVEGKKALALVHASQPVSCAMLTFGSMYLGVLTQGSQMLHNMANTQAEEMDPSIYSHGVPALAQALWKVPDHAQLSDRNELAEDALQALKCIAVPSPTNDGLPTFQSVLMSEDSINSIGCAALLAHGIPKVVVWTMRHQNEAPALNYAMVILGSLALAELIRNGSRVTVNNAEFTSCFPADVIDVVCTSMDAHFNSQAVLRSGIAALMWLVLWKGVPPTSRVAAMISKAERRHPALQPTCQNFRKLFHHEEGLAGWQWGGVGKK